MSAKQIAAAKSTKDFRRPQRFAFLDFLRFAAALAVVGYHLTALAHPWAVSASTEIFPRLPQLTKYGVLGVDLFFIISGFVILSSVNGRSLGQFITSRVSRIFPAFWVSVLLAGLLFLFLWTDKKDVTLSQILLNLTMTNSASGVAHLDGVFWTLWVELKFYVLMAFFVVWGVTPKRILAVCTLWPIAASLAIQFEAPILRESLIAMEAALFAGGMMIYFIHKYGWSLIAGLVLGLNVATAVHRAGWVRTGGIGSRTGSAGNELVVDLIVLGFFVLVLIATVSPARNLYAPWMTWLGLFTYPLYLVHEIWGWWVIKMLRDTHSAYFTLGVALAFVFVLAFALLKLVDQPGGRWLKKRLEKDFAALDALNVNAPVSPKAVEKSLPASGSDFDTPPVPVRNEPETDRASS